jgi:hypothetical protein
LNHKTIGVGLAARTPRGTATAIAAAAVAAILGACAPQHASADQQPPGQQSPAAAGPAASSTPTQTSSPVGLTPGNPGQPPTQTAGNGQGQGGPGPATATVVVSAVTASYSGACPPPVTATTFRAVISVPAGPMTVTFRWTTSNGGDSDPSTQSVHFSGDGPQSTTVYHNEHWYPGAPYPAQKSDWVAVNLASPVQAQSNHVPITINCLPFTVAIKRTSGDYKGACPPPNDSVGFDLYVTSSVDSDATVHWQLSNNGDSGPNPTATVHLTYGTNVVHHYEIAYPPAPYPATHSDWVAATVTVGSFSAPTDKVTFSIMCTS